MNKKIAFGNNLKQFSQWYDVYTFLYYKKSLFLTLIFVFAYACVYCETAVSLKAPQDPLDFQINNLGPIGKNDRIFILAPHPDDESIGCAGIIQQALKAGADIHILYLTNGDHNQFSFIIYEKRLTFRKGEFIHMGQIRRKEAVTAMNLLGLNERNLIFLGYPDFGTFVILRDFWQTEKPYRSILTRISSVPYKENLSFGAPYVGESILDNLKSLLKRYRPNKIFVSHPIDVNSDHKTFYLFLEAALADLHKEYLRPEIYSYLIHWKGWPLPRRYHPELNLTPPEEFRGSQMVWYKYELTRRQLEKKHKAILCYRSQTLSSAFYLLSFARKNELFGYFSEINPGDTKPDSQTGSKNADHQDVQAKAKAPVTYALSGDSFTISINKGRERGNRFRLVVYIFGYNYKVPFGQMPKIRIITRSKSFKVYNGSKKVNAEGISLEAKPEEWRLKIPLRVLGDPDFVLASVRGGSRISCVDTMGFRKVNIRGDKSDGGI